MQVEENKTNINWERRIYGKLARNIENTHFLYYRYYIFKSKMNKELK